MGQHIHLRGVCFLGAVALLVAVTSLGSGCVSAGGPINGVQVTKDVQYQDIPVPMNFSFDSKKSWAYTRFEEGPLGLRSFELVYWGDRPLRELSEWFKDQMPKHDWHLTDTLGGRDIRLVFAKGPANGFLTYLFGYQFFQYRRSPGKFPKR